MSARIIFNWDFSRFSLVWAQAYFQPSSLCWIRLTTLCGFCALCYACTNRQTHGGKIYVGNIETVNERESHKTSVRMVQKSSVRRIWSILNMLCIHFPQFNRSLCWFQLRFFSMCYAENTEWKTNTQQCNLPDGSWKLYILFPQNGILWLEILEWMYENVLAAHINIHRALTWLIRYRMKYWRKKTVEILKMRETFFSFLIFLFFLLPVEPLRWCFVERMKHITTMTLSTLN